VIGGGELPDRQTLRMGNFLIVHTGKRARPVLRGPRRSNAPGLPDEVYFSILQRKAIERGDFADLDALAARVMGFQALYNQTATRFDWKYTRADLLETASRLNLAA